MRIAGNFMKKSEVYEYLNSRNIRFETTEHEPVFNMAEAASVPLPYPDAEAKNLFVRDGKKNYYLLVVKGNKRVNLKKFRRENGIGALSFASEQELTAVLGLTPGSVTPLGILNDTEHKVQCFIDKEFTKDAGLIGVHPNDNTATVWLKTRDLIDLIKENGNTVHTAEF